MTNPKSTGSKRQHRATQSRFLALGSDPFVNAVPQPDVCIHVPTIEENFEVWRELDILDIDIRSTVPECFSRRGIAVEAKTS